MKKLHLITLVAVSLLIASCSTSGKAVDNASIQGDWMILSALGISTASGEETPYIKFDGKEKVNGFAGVNRFFGSDQCTKGNSHKHLTIKERVAIDFDTQCRQQHQAEECHETQDRLARKLRHLSLILMQENTHKERCELRCEE